MLKIITRHHKRLRYTYLKLSGGILFLAALFFPSYVKWEQPKENFFTVYLDGECVGSVENPVIAEELLVQARRNVASGSEGLTFIEAEMTTVGQAILWGLVDEKESVEARMEQVLLANVRETLQKSYVVKVNDYMINLASREEVEVLLQTAVDKYDTEDRYQVKLVHEEGREFEVLTAHIVDTKPDEQMPLAVEAWSGRFGGINRVLEEAFSEAEPAVEKDFSDYEQGLVFMDFCEEVEIVEAYLNASQLSTVEKGVEDVIQEQEVNSVYEVVSGDTLSEISMKVSVPMEQLVALNDSLETENSIIRVGQELTITIPEPKLSVERQEEWYLEETYDADIIYVDNDDWYTTQTKTLQEPSAGFRRVIVLLSFHNDRVVGREIVKEEIIKEAVPKIVERGTKVPPTFIKPISGGRLSSTFGRRTAPKAGASSYHKGVDWATPVGTTVVAASSGTVVKAGWGSGYGYVVYIDHGDGRQTRYAHLSRVLVSVGQQVSQGQKIALSGNTGVSTGPHVHFEILINGTQVNPLNYIK